MLGFCFAACLSYGKNSNMSISFLANSDSNFELYQLWF